MFEFSNLIGLTEEKAKELLRQNGVDLVEVVVNSKHNERCDSKLVCAVRQKADGVELVLGEFCLDLKEK